MTDIKLVGGIAPISVIKRSSDTRIATGIPQKLNSYITGTIDVYDAARDGVAFTHTGGEYSYSFRSGNFDPDSWYNAVFPAVESYDALRGAVQVESGSTIDHAAAVSGYARSAQAATGGGTNAVALFGLGIAAVNDAAVWGLNTLLQDDDIRLAGTDTGRKTIGGEFDFNIMNPNTEVIGVSVGGNSLAQPTTANAFLVNTLGTGYKWTTGFWSLDGAATNGLVIGASAASGTSIAGQTVLLSYFDSGATKRSIQMQATGGFLIFSQSGGTFSGLKVNASQLLLDTGQSLVVNGNAVISDRKTGWGAPTGTATRSTYATFGGQTITDPPTQSEVQAIDDHTVILSERLHALIDDLTSHGMIGT